MDTVSLLKVESYDKNLKDKIIDLVNLIGGFSTYIKQGDRVLLKPNFVVASPAVTAINTNPDFIAAVVEILSDYGCSIAIGDSPMVGTAEAASRALGLYEKLKKYDVKYMTFQNPVPAMKENDRLKNRIFKELNIAGELNEYDKIINLPKLKTHAQMGMSLATKNLYGCVVGKEKRRWHFITGNSMKFARLLVEVSRSVAPTLNILDGIEGMDLMGPTNGRKRKTNVILASTNCIALDRVVVELIKKKPSSIPIFKAAEDLSLTGTDIKKINIAGDRIEDCYIKNFELLNILPTDFIGVNFLGKPFKRMVTQRIVIDQEKCKRCRRCEENCPARAISYNGRININYDMCIRCCCCQESCPSGAVTIYDPPLVKLFKRKK